LVRVSGCAVFTDRVAAGAEAVQALVEDDAIARTKTLGQRTDFLDYSDDLVA
jgi:hypothetical protein